MASTSNVLTANWSSIGNAQVIQQVDLENGFVNVSVSDSVIRTVINDFIEGNTLF